MTGQPSACGTVREVGTVSHGLPGGLLVANAEHRKLAEQLWNLPPGRISEKPGHHTVEMWKRFSTPRDKGGDIDTIWVQVTNPGQTLPNSHLLFEPSRKLPEKFLIVSDVYPTATVRDVNVDERLFNEYRAFSRKKHKDLAPYQEYVKARGLRWPVIEKDGVWKETRWRFAGGAPS